MNNWVELTELLATLTTDIVEQKLVKLFSGFCGLDWKPCWWDRGVCWLHLPLSTSAFTCLRHRRTGTKHNEMITKAHFLSQLKGKISRFPQQISSNEWFIICLKHGSSWMWSLWPPFVGLINHIITYTTGNWSSWTAASVVRASLHPTVRPVRGRVYIKNLLKCCPSSSVACRASHPASPHVSQVFIYDTEAARCWCWGPVNIIITSFFISASCLKTKGLDVTAPEPSVWTGTHAGAGLFPSYYRNIGMHKSSVNAVRICLWLDPATARCVYVH